MRFNMSSGLTLKGSGLASKAPHTPHNTSRYALSPNKSCRHHPSTPLRTALLSAGIELTAHIKKVKICNLSQGSLSLPGKRKADRQAEAGKRPSLLQAEGAAGLGTAAFVR